MNAEQWEDFNERKQREAEYRKKYGNEAQLSLLHNLYAMIFRIYGHIRNEVKDMNLAIILMALRHRDNISQADIARDYGIPTGTIGNIVEKHSGAPMSALMVAIPDKKHKNRKILKLTKSGEQKAEELLAFMQKHLERMGKAEDARYLYIDKLTEPLTEFYDCVIDKKNALKKQQKKKSARVKAKHKKRTNKKSRLG